MGAFAATVGMVLPAFLAIVLLAAILSEIISNSYIQHIFWGVGIGVIVLLFLAVKEMWKKSVRDKFSMLVYGVCLLLALWGKIPLAIIIIGALFASVFWQKIKDRRGGIK